MGEWSLNYSNGMTLDLKIANNGKASVTTTKNLADIEQSDNDQEFPSSEGWIKINGLFGQGHWQYYRIDNEGKLEAKHFCGLEACRNTFGSLRQFCCHGVGIKKESKFKLAIKTTPITQPILYK